MCFLYVGAAPSLSEWDSTSEASTSSTIHPCQTCPATSTQGNPPGRAARAAQMPRRWAARAADILTSAAASSSANARQAVGEEATACSTACDWRSTSTAPATEVAPNECRQVTWPHRRRECWPRGGWWSGVEEGLAVVAAEQEGEPVEVLLELVESVGGVAEVVGR